MKLECLKVFDAEVTSFIPNPKVLLNPPRTPVLGKMGDGSHCDIASLK